MKNIIDAIINLVKGHNDVLKNTRVINNRMNAEGYALEDYVKNLFADSFNCDAVTRMEKWSDVFSWLGNNSNPPDFMLKHGDAVEVKKIQSNDSNIALNSSCPKQTLLSTNSLISSACRIAEDWREKDMLYVVGVVNSNRLKHLCMIYGRDYCASDECYNRTWQSIKNAIESIPNIEFSTVNGSGRVNHMDFFENIYRGMWHIKNPWKVFEYVYKRNLQARFTFMCIINIDKWNTQDNRLALSALQNIPSFKIVDIKIKNPDNPAILRPAKLISYEY